MISQAVARSKHQLSPAPVSKHRLLIVTDCSDRLTGLRALLHADEVEITSAASPEELSRACQGEHDQAVVDVGPAHLPEALKILRASQGHATISVLVEASRIVAEPGLTGLLPKYRAMPCSRSDLVKLTRRQVISTDRPWRRRMLL
jgi:hypothetical protein